MWGYHALLSTGKSIQHWTGSKKTILFLLGMGWGGNIVHAIIDHCVDIAVGLPAPIVAIAAGIAHTHYGTND